MSLQVYNNSEIILSFRSDDERRHCKKYSLGMESFKAVIDIPPEFDGTDTFQPTFGPKVKTHQQVFLDKNFNGYKTISSPTILHFMIFFTYG